MIRNVFAFGFMRVCVLTSWNACFCTHGDAEANTPSACFEEYITKCMFKSNEMNGLCVILVYRKLIS
jgi:hypothetical protein